MLVILLIFSNAVQSVYSCIPTASSPMPGLLACRKCAQNLITVPAGVSSNTVVNNGCLERTLTCTGMPGFISISYNNGVEVINDGGTGMAIIVATCNAAGTAWIDSIGTTIEQAECTIACLTCMDNLITTAAGVASNIAVANGCLERTLTCTGMSGFISMSYNNGAGSITDGGTGMAIIVANCNPAGTAWIDSMGTTITQAECTIACLSCANNLITLAAGVASNNVVANGCLERTLTCTGMPGFISISYNNGMGVINDGGTGMANIVATCNAAGSAWEDSAGTAITQAQCITNPCKQCGNNLFLPINVDAPAGVTGGRGTSPVDNSGQCTRYRVTCMGIRNAWQVYGDAAGTVLLYTVPAAPATSNTPT
ncbi:hypothetical protein PENTCL1PPCAC_4739, partial [Pristionchus entomophagus]